MNRRISKCAVSEFAILPREYDVGQSTMTIRKAEIQDAGGIVGTCIDSIRNSCFKDHLGKSDNIEKWLFNKTSENAIKWIDNPDVTLYVSVDEDRINSVCMMTSSGYITLTYVNSEEQGRGIGRELLNAIETHARKLRLDRLTLDSSQTGKEFYERVGFISNGDPKDIFGMKVFPMMKMIAQPTGAGDA